MKLAIVLCLVGLAYAANLSTDENQKYFGAQVLRVTPSSDSEVQYLNKVFIAGEYNFWSLPSVPGKPLDIMATMWQTAVLKQTLTNAGIAYEVLVQDLYDNIYTQKHLNDAALKKAREEGKAMEWTAYHDYDEIMEWVDSLPGTYPSLVTVQDVGTSYEGRTMKLVTVSTGGSGKPSMFVDGGIHAREWISPATVTYIMNEILSNSEAYSSVLDVVDLQFMPSINPDGYAYSWSTDRLWRKTRSPTDSGLGCIGVDANRNWDFHWMESGSSSNACSDIYAGPTPFSEVETQIVRDQMVAASATAQVYISFHSYSQVWLYPWGYDSSLPSDWEELDALANSAVDALTAVHGTVFEVGGSGSLLYPAAGASDDYAKGVAGIKYAYTVELRDTGFYGFELPPDQIIPVGEETFAAFEVVMNFVRDTYGKKN